MSTVSISDSKVETISRMAQWKIHNFGSSTYKQSDPFRIGIWNWRLSVEKNRYLNIWLFLEPSRTSKEQPPSAAKCVLRLTAPTINRGPLAPTATDYNKGVIQSSTDNHKFVWPVQYYPQGQFVIDVEFYDLKIAQSGEGWSSIWAASDSRMWLLTMKTTPLRCVSRMLLESIHTDITINTADNGSLQAHKAILCAASPVFQTMFYHDLIEKQSSTIHIQDMSTDLCAAFLGYLYGTIKPDLFWKHRLELLAVANKYDISDLKDHCEESLLADMDTGNVFELLQEAWVYQYHKLRNGCFKYLFEFGKIYDMKEEMRSNFLRQQTDKELTLQIFQQLFHPHAYLPTAISDEFEIVVNQHLKS